MRVSPLPVTEQMDNLLAQELERRERAAFKVQEQREFEKLQVSFHLPSTGISAVICRS